MLNATCRACAPSSPGTVTFAFLSEPVHSGYDSKSAITPMIVAGSAAMLSDCDEGVAMDGRLPRSTGCGCPPVRHARCEPARTIGVRTDRYRTAAETAGNGRR